MDMSQYLEIFIEESKENLQNMNQSLLELEQNPKDNGIVHEIFRIAHTLKGMSSTMGFSKIASLTHQMENVLQSLRNDEISVSERIIDVLFECLDMLEEYINKIVHTGEEGNIDAHYLIEKLNHILHGEQAPEAEKEDKIDTHAIGIEVEEHSKKVLIRATEEGYYCYKLQIDLNPNCMLKSARAFIIFNTLEKHSEILKSNPSVEDIEDEKFNTSFELIIVTKYVEEDIKEKIINISEVENVFVEEIDMDTVGVLSEDMVENSVILDNNLTEKNLSHEGEKEDGENHSKKPKLGKTVRVDIDRLDNLMNLVSELIITRSRLQDIDALGKRHNMNEAIEYLERITTNLHDAVMKVRMVPIERVFNRFPRMVRDLSKELGKEISLIMSGEETEVDRTVIDEIGDPLIHLIRNSIDHGIENPETRKKYGKSEVGIVKLKAYPDGNNVVIEVEDDGDGIDIEKVKKKAIKKGLVTNEQCENMEDKEIVNFLFKSGFSTAEKISDISGRGVGLDVVKTKIESLGGIVEIQTTKSRGSKFTIRLPLTLAIIQALLVNIGLEKYAIPLNSIKEIVTIQAKDIRKIQHQEIVLYRNTTLPILRLADILEISNRNDDETNLTVVVVKKGDKTAGLIVDDLIGQQEIVIKSLGKFLSGIKIIAGATILGNGQVALIIDTNSLF
ncbi:chemotaxis protein CheA [Clostridiaceae bacterium 35-E11]